MDTQSLNIHDNPPKRRNIAESMPFLPPFAAMALRLLHRTCRIEIVGKENYLAAEKINPRIAAFWHFAYPSVLYFYRDQGYLTIISRSRDGEFAARLVKSLGYNPFRGSPGKGGAAALKGIISAFRNGPGVGSWWTALRGRRRWPKKDCCFWQCTQDVPLCLSASLRTGAGVFEAGTGRFFQSLLPGWSSPGVLWSASRGGLQRLKWKNAASGLSEFSTKSAGRRRRPQRRLHKALNLLIYYSERDCLPGEL